MPELQVGYTGGFSVTKESWFFGTIRVVPRDYELSSLSVETGVFCFF